MYVLSPGYQIAMLPYDEPVIFSIIIFFLSFAEMRKAESKCKHLYRQKNIC